MNKNGLRKRAVAWVAAAALLVGMTGGQVSADTSTTVITMQDVQYHQTEARSMFSMVNAFRTSTTDAWYWNEDNTTKTTYNTGGNASLSELVYDYSLEQIAMQRAAEIALNWSHTRPNGERCFTATANNFRSYGENIAIGYSSVEAAFVGWQESSDNYSGQGHRRNMLKSGFQSIGIGYAVVNGIKCYVQEFSYYKSNAAATTAEDGKRNVDVKTLNSYISKVTATPSATSVTVEKGETAALPTLTQKVKLTGTWSYVGMIPITQSYTWTSADTSVATVTGNQVTGVKGGTTQLTTSILGQTVTVSVTVTEPETTEATTAEKTTQKTTTEKTTEKTTEATTAEKTTEKTTQATTTEKTTEKTTQATTAAKTTEKTTQATTTEKTTEKTTQAKTTERTTQAKTTEKTTQAKATEKTTEETAEKTAEETAQETAEYTTEKTTQATTTEFTTERTTPTIITMQETATEQTADSQHQTEKVSLNREERNAKIVLLDEDDYEVTEADDADIEEYEDEDEVKRPSKPKVQKVKSVKKGFQVRLKKQKQSFDGYEVAYATKKDMKKAKYIRVASDRTTTWNKGIRSGKKYYIRTRTYRIVKVNGDYARVYSKWTAWKSVKVK